MKIAVTAFEPFGGEKVNPSQQVLDRIGVVTDGVKVVKKVLPVSYVSAEKELLTLLREEDPDMVLCMGQAGGRAAPSFEKIAVNYDEADIPDNDGLKRSGAVIRPDGPAAYFSNLPLKKMVDNIHKENMPAYISWDAGRFICNHVFYCLMEWIHGSKPGALGGFLHLPYSTAQAAAFASRPSMSLDDMAAVAVMGLKSALGAETGE